MKAKLYAQALEAMYPKYTEGDREDVLVTSLLDLLKQRGHRGLLARIIRELKKSSHQSLLKDDLVLTVASSSDLKQHEPEVKALAQKLHKHSWTVVEDSTLIGGYTLGTARAFIDRSHKRQLIDLFKKLV